MTSLAKRIFSTVAGSSVFAVLGTAALIALGGLARIAATPAAIATEAAKTSDGRKITMVGNEVARVIKLAPRGGQ